MNQFVFQPNVMDIPDLESFLEAKEAMPLPMMDGLLTAIAIGPEIIMPSEWFPLIFGGEPELESEKQAGAVFGTVMEWYNGILRALSDAPEEYEPFLSCDEDGEAVFEDWALGFLAGMELRSKAWAPLFKSEEYSMYLSPIIVHMPGETDPDLYNMVCETLREDPLRLADSVLQIDCFWKQARQYFQGRTKIGRNDPCFCRSGKKFKKCCGTN